VKGSIRIWRDGAMRIELRQGDLWHEYADCPACVGSIRVTFDLREGGRGFKVFMAHTPLRCDYLKPHDRSCDVLPRLGIQIRGGQWASTEYIN
jgi:hypothetical protein